MLWYELNRSSMIGAAADFDIFQCVFIISSCIIICNSIDVSFNENLVIASSLDTLSKTIPEYCLILRENGRRRIQIGRSVLISITLHLYEHCVNRRIRSKNKKLALFLVRVLAGAQGFEPWAYGFGDRRSTSWATPLYILFCRFPISKNTCFRVLKEDVLYYNAFCKAKTNGPS